LGPVTDIWVNLFTPKALHDLYFTNPELTAVVEWWGMHDRVRGHEPAEFVEILDQAGVDRVLIPAFKMWSYRDHHWMWNLSTEEIHDVIAPYPDRMFGMEGIDPREGLSGLRRLERAVTEFGFVAAHYHSHGFNIAINDARMYPYYAKCAELDVPIVVQIGHSAEQMPSSTARPILIDEIALHFPELRFVASHTGWPWTEELIAMAWKHPNVFIGASAHAPKYWDEKLVSFINSRGRGKALFGTDFPVLTPGDAVGRSATSA
jgi:predicted TIM-barrel fold metal-dependent hydrolase